MILAVVDDGGTVHRVGTTEETGLGRALTDVLGNLEDGNRTYVLGQLDGSTRDALILVDDDGRAYFVTGTANPRALALVSSAMKNRSPCGVVRNRFVSDGDDIEVTG